VYLNGVPQQPGSDYEIRDGALIFPRALAQEGKLGFKAWFLGFWGIGTYGKNDTVDIRYEQHGRPLVAHALPLEPIGDRP
jgi:hypothetical protein